VNVSEKMPELEEIEVWAKELDIVGTRIGGRFERSEPRERAVRYIQGLMSDIPRKNGWQLLNMQAKQPRMECNGC
jgi:hypothetical protein